MIDEARSTANFDVNTAIYRELQQKLVGMQTDVFLLTQNSQLSVSECIENFTSVPMVSFEFNFHTMPWACA